MKSAPAPSEGVRGEWLRRVEAEYTSAAVTQHLGLWLLQLGASPDLVKAALRIVLDEMEHARLSYAVLVRAGGQGAPALVQEQLELRRTGEGGLFADVARVALSVFCLGETVAVPLFKKLREGCTVPVARKALDRVLRDEVRHRDFGWMLFDWLLEQPYGEQVRALAARELPGMFVRLADHYGVFDAEARAGMSAADRAWGLMRTVEYGATVRRTLERDWIPRFRERGVDAKAAWEQGVVPLLGATTAGLGAASAPVQGA